MWNYYSNLKMYAQIYPYFVLMLWQELTIRMKQTECLRSRRVSYGFVIFTFESYRYNLNVFWSALNENID